MLLLVLLLTIAVGSLVAAAFISARQEKKRQQQQQVRNMKRRVTELEELALAIDPLVEVAMIPRLINDEAISLLHKIAEIDKTQGFTAAALHNAERRGNEMASPDREHRVSRLCGSDMQIARAQHLLEEAASAIKKAYNNDKFSAEELDTFVNELRWQHLQVEVISIIGQGHKAMHRSDVLSAHAFYKKAQQILINHGHKDQRRHQQIKQISEMLTQKRSALDESLMPETELNPKSDINLEPEPSKQVEP